MSELIELHDIEEREDDSRVEDDIEQVAEQRRNRMSEDAKRLNDSLNKKLAEIEKNANRVIDDEIVIDDEDGGLRRSSDQNTELRRNKQLAEAMDRLADEMSKITGESRKPRLWVRFKFLSWVFGLAIATAGVAVAIFAVANPSSPGSQGSTDSLSDEDKNKISDLIQTWKSESDSQFWNSMADYVDTWKPSLQAQLLFMTYTQQFSDKAKWPDGTSDQINARKDQLEAAFTTSTVPLDQRTTSALYRVVPSLAPLALASPQPPFAIPRYLAADLCSLALADIIANLRLHRS